MPSSLTRNVYLRLLASHGLLRPCAALPSRCLAVPSRPRPCPCPCPHSHPHQYPLLVRRQPRRTFFGIFQKPPRMLKEPEIEPGYDVLLLFNSLETDNARPPAREELLKGWRQFVQHKRRNHRRALNSTQAYLTLQLLSHLVETAPETEGHGDDLSFSDLRAALWVTATRPPKGTSEYHLELAKLLYGEIERRIQNMRDLGIDEEMIKEAVGGKDAGDFELFLTALTQYGGSLEAAERLAEFRAQLDGEQKMAARVKVFWTLVLRGLAKEGREEDLLREYKKAEEAHLEYLPQVHEIMTTFFASRDRVEETKHWFEKPIHANRMRSPKAYMAAVRFAIRNGEQQWLQPIFEQLINSNPPKEWWDVVFQWAVLVLDKGVEDIKQMIQVMSTPKEGREGGKQGKEGPKPDAATIDALIQAAIEKQNPYLAERFLSLGAELQIQPRASTYILQMDYRLDAKDFSGVQAIYDKLLKGEVTVSQDEDLPVLNKYLRALCAVAEPDLGRILDITADLEHRHATLEPETVVALCMVFLRSDNQYDVIDTLSLHTVSYSLEERAQVRRAFVEYCLDRRVSTARVWDCYSLLRQFFPETEPAERVRLMDAFFARRRPDMACLVFGHMRSQDSPAQRPTPDMYVRCLEGLGAHPDPESLRMVYNMLKMDTSVQLDTRLYNGLMLAHAACDEPDTAVDFWRDITNSAEGPSYRSLEIVFWACERLPYGDRTARGIWQKMQRLDLDVPPEVFAAYCGALAGSGHLEEVIRLIRGMEASVGYGPGMMTLGVTYNALPGRERKEQFEAWAKAEYPDIWSQLEKKGRQETLRGTKFNIVRELKA
ncbi:uncharacterized protein THITE_2106536 [Thermothielavioides terrestris NRRL 8126]|uniref:Complex I intermediate-associated protein 84, mitochondrial n=1 Tax=Thermothielavioides terrestris (strain ATCC 38088 / NRRL 8126) TaxID=578455 RepID=G2QQK0_THETT|nr:uncharacterized protein THITE_2106536 [Thermothielavioides terrestris NRRL 8126]AEO62410.1 hypothetical protein THITE_2106536 [Thermothielavioides terrestris NRRL 8126]